MKRKSIFLILLLVFVGYFNVKVKASSVEGEKLQSNIQSEMKAIDLQALPDCYEAKEDHKSLKITNSQKDNMGITHITLAMNADGYYTDHDEIKLHISPGNKLLFINGDLKQKRPTITNKIKLTEQDAIEKAFEAIGQNEASVSSYTGSPVKEKRVIVNSRTKRLVYSIRLIFSEPIVASWIIQIDTETGAVLRKQNMLSEANSCNSHGTKKNIVAPGKGYNPSLQRALNVWKIRNIFCLVDRTRKGLIRTFDLNHNTEISQGKIVSNKVNMFTAPEYCSAVDAHYYAGEVYDYFKKVHNHESLDGEGGGIDSFVRYGLNCNNAFWDGQEILYGDGDRENYKPFSCARNIVGHELTHAVIQYTAGLEYEGQSGALNESFADVFSYFITPDNWLIGEDVCLQRINSKRVRSLKEPDKYNQAAHMNEYESMPITEEYDWGGVHFNSGIPNKAAYNTITKVGKEKAEQLYFRALKYYLTKKSQFVDAKNALQQAARDLYSEEVARKVGDAWEEVGVR
ncbi:peptidase M4 [Listeria ivanovii]|uniref:M4 family metallopeptidase n=1 Tax=Listeria ivanovii TaxID=1638 RepID=UPI000DA8C4BB|nr:M4 family metallopeptidase [Listeria ivanovii]PZG31384.1 peptidase M4 [Listeria ivanovii]PZG45200.1 peptidase M4 [Listeria ivanovii]PZH08680.1 peptidase M4 [Listeria ivanovii]